MSTLNSFHEHFIWVTNLYNLTYENMATLTVVKNGHQNEMHCEDEIEH